MLYNDFFWFSSLLFPKFPRDNDLPPTMYSLMESLVNYNKDIKIKIKDLSKSARLYIFDFEYPLTSNISKEKFECMILNHFIMRRIGFDTFTMFQMQLDVKLNEIMPLYNKMFDAIQNWDIFNDGSNTSRKELGDRVVDTNNTLNSNSSTGSSEKSDRRFSELPQNLIQDVQDGKYVTDYNYDQNTTSGTDTSNTNGISNTIDINSIVEEIKKSPINKVDIYKDFASNLNKIYQLIFKDLDCLFYQLV